MKTIEELRREQSALESQMADLRRKEQAAKDSATKRAVDVFEKAEGVHVGISDDYATLTLGQYGKGYEKPEPDTTLSFYFGYEETLCPVHGTDGDACWEAECGAGGWAFVVKDCGKEVMRLGRSSLHPKAEEVEESLLCGIGIWLERQRKSRPSSP